MASQISESQLDWSLRSKKPINYFKLAEARQPRGVLPSKYGVKFMEVIVNFWYTDTGWKRSGLLQSDGNKFLRSIRKSCDGWLEQLPIAASFNRCPKSSFLPLILLLSNPSITFRRGPSAACTSPARQHCLSFTAVECFILWCFLYYPNPNTTSSFLSANISFHLQWIFFSFPLFILAALFWDICKLFSYILQCYAPNPATTLQQHFS